ncbi:MAG: hypothetical protein OIF32_07590 [Campylobacterales bacterium]|nr:hypothetical protein [Campylobacterales bacterium]
MINTGEPRNVTGHVVSGAAASAIVATGLNYSKYKKEEISKEEAIKNGVKLTVQGGIATGSAIAAANYLGQGKTLGFLSALAVGALGVYSVEKISEKIEEQKLIEEE